MLFRMAGFAIRARTIFSASLSILTAPLLAAPPTGANPLPARSAPEKPAPVAPKKRPAAEETAPAAPVPEPPSDGSRGTAHPSAKGSPEYADALPSEYRLAAADLQLKSEDGRKADALAAFAQGLLAEDSADADAMLASYRRALELDPGYAELAVKVAYELARRNDVSGGIQILKDAIKAAPKEPLPYIYLSQLYANYLKKPDLALTYAEQALALAPENFKSHLALYELYVSTGQKKKADAVFERTVKSESKDPQFWVDLGEQLKKLYLKDDGSCAPEELKQMNAVYEKLGKMAAGDAVVLSKVADYYVLSKQVKEAIPLYLTVLKLRPGADDPLASDVREKLARSLVFTGQRDDAIAIFEKLAADYPDRFETYETLGELYQQKGEFDKALASFEHSLPLDSSEPRNHLRIADLLQKAQKFDKAVEVLQQARKKFPDLPFITFNLALALSQAQRHDEALKTFAEAQTDAEARNEELLNAGFYFTYGAAAEQAGKLDKAVELLKQSIELDPNSSWAERPGTAYNYLGYMWADRGERLDEAGELIKKAIELDPDNGSYLDSLGWFYFKKGNYERGLKELLRAQENILREDKKDSAEVLDHIAETYAKLGKNAEALAVWQKAMALPQEDDRSKELAHKIAEKLEAAKQKMTSGTPLPEPGKQ